MSMTDDKFTVEEIVKGLECLDGKHDRLCGKCPIYKAIRLNEGRNGNCRHIILDEAIKIINRKKTQGEWIKTEYDKGKFYFACSTKCGEALTEIEEKNLPNYCPNCGAKMKGENK